MSAGSEGRTHLITERGSDQTGCHTAISKRMAKSIQGSMTFQGLQPIPKKEAKA